MHEEGSDGWTLLVNPDTAGAMAVNHTGALIWKLVDGRRTTGEITAAIRGRFPDAPDTVADDVLSLLTKLAEEGFIGQEIPLEPRSRRGREERKSKGKSQISKVKTADGQGKL